MTAAMFQTMRNALAEQKQNPFSLDDVTAMVAGQIGQLTPMDEETAGLFQKLTKKMLSKQDSNHKEYRKAEKIFHCRRRESVIYLS